MARTLGYQMPKLLTREIISSYQGIHKKQNQFYRVNICKSLLFPFLIGACLMICNFGAAHAKTSEIAKDDNITHANQLGSNTADYTSIDDTWKLLQDGEKLLHLDGNKNVILMLGNTGSGKTTLTHFIAGDDSKLRSVKLEAETGEYFVKDENEKAGVYSKNIIPERVLDAVTGLVYYNCPGFSDTRNAVFDIASNYFLKKIVDHARSVKIVFTISYTSVRVGGDPTDFMKLVRHANEFIKDIEKFKESVALVVTKVDNEYFVKNKKFVLVSDDKIIEKIAKYIRQVREALQEKLKIEQSPREIKFYTKSIVLLDIFLNEKRGQYVNIALFRRPDMEGLLGDIELLQDGKKYIKNVIENNIGFTKKNRDDFGFRVSDNSKLNILKLADKINKHVVMDIFNASHEIEKVVKLKAGSGNFYKTKENMNLIYEELIKSQEELKKCSLRREFVEKFIHFINSLNIKNSRKIFLSILNKYEYLEFLEQVNHENYGQKGWTKPLRSIIKYARQSKIWYTFLTDLYEKLSRFEMHTNFYNEVVKKIAKNEQSTEFVNIHELMESLKGYGVKYYKEVIDLELDFKKQQEADSVLKSVYGDSVTFECLKNALIIKGGFIKFSDINFANPCSKPIKTIKIFGLNTIFIDADLVKTADKVNIFMLAPRWEVIGTRKIIVDGAQGSESSSAPPGQDGKPGLPGGTAGNFIGAVIEIINAENLTISANGGNGGKGQNGGEGLPGMHGHRRVPSGTFKEGEQYMALDGFKFERTEVFHTYPPEFIFGAFIYNDFKQQHYITYGKKATAGQDGGMGGAGGKGGFKGKVSIYGLNNAKNIFILRENGSDGSAGTGGVGGKGGTHGAYCYVYHETNKRMHISAMISQESHWAVTSCHYAGVAPDGRTNTNIFYTGIKNPDDINSLIIHYPVNKYKSYLLGNIKNSIKDHLLMKFYSQLINDTAIGDSYDSIGLCHELKILEKHFYNLHKIIKMQDLYSSLIKRIVKYSKSPKGYELSLPHKKLLNFLHAAILSKFLNLKNDPRSDLVLNVDNFFNFITNIEKIKYNAKQIAITEFNKDYKKKIDDKIKETQSFIKKLIIPHLEEDEQRIGYEFDKLIDEILIMQNNSEIKKYELIEKQKALENCMRTKGIFSVLKIFAVASQYFGPMGEAFSKVIETTSKVNNSLIYKAPSTPELSVSVPGGVANLFEVGITFLENFMHSKASVLNQFMDKILKKIQKYPNEFKEISTVLSALKSNLANLKNQNDLNPSLITSIIENIKEVLTNKTKSIHSNSSQVNNIKNHTDKFLNKIFDKLDLFINTAEIVEIFTDDYIKNQGDKEKLMLMVNAIQRQQSATDALRKYQTDMYQTVFSLIRVFRKNLSKFTSSNFVATTNILDKKFTSLFKDIKMTLRKITNGFKVEDSIQHYIDQMEETVTLSLKIYEKVDQYNEVKELSDYIADINSAVAKQITTDNHTINTALSYLDVMIDCNIVIDQFQKAVYTFKQFVFPFSSYYIQQFDLHVSLGNLESLGNLVSAAINQIKKLNATLTEHNLSIKKPINMYIYEAYFQTRENESGPFFVWDGDEYNSTISKLLSGKPIVLKSNILTSIHEKNAIKFNKIEINFNSDNKELLHDLKQHLKEFDVTMKHSGLSYYRCDNSFYLIKSDSQILYYSFEKNEQGEPVRKNNVYTIIKNGHYMLSPYTLWTIQLKHINNFPFNTLQKFIGKVDLELVGHGQFVSTESSICSTDLKEFYEPVDTISVTDTLQEKF